MKKSFLMAVLAVMIGAILIIGAAGCAQPSTDHMHMSAAPKSKSAATKSAANEKADLTVTISAGKFIPADLMAKAGDTVKWINKDSQAHEIHADDDAFESSTLEPGQSFSQKFKAPGDFGYHDHLHEEIKGMIMVE